MFFGPKGEEVCGMFTAGHIAAMIVCFLTVAVLFIILKDKDRDQKYFLIRIFALIFTLLEGEKIYHNFYHGYTNVDSWLPLSFCSLFIYALWMSGFGKGLLREIGNSFLVLGGIVAGIMFILMPTTSLTLYPLWHFQCIYSLTFHSAMILTGLLILRSEVKLSVRLYTVYICFFCVFAVIAISINMIFGSNLMLLHEPYNIPVELLHIIQHRSVALYTAVACVCYIVIPPFGAWIASLCVPKKQKMC